MCVIYLRAISKQTRAVLPSDLSPGQKWCCQCKCSAFQTRYDALEPDTALFKLSFFAKFCLNNYNENYFIYMAAFWSYTALHCGKLHYYTCLGRPRKPCRFSSARLSSLSSNQNTFHLSPFYVSAVWFPYLWKRSVRLCNIRKAHLLETRSAREPRLSSSSWVSVWLDAGRWQAPWEGGAHTALTRLPLDEGNDIEVSMRDVWDDSLVKAAVFLQSSAVYHHR